MLNEDKKQFAKEQDQLLKTILDLRYFLPWEEDNCSDEAIRNDANLEIFITNVCNQNCEYCYLVKHEGLYPKEYRSPELLLNHLRILYNLILNKGYHIPKCEFFSGEIWHTQFGLDVLELTLDYLHRGMAIDWFMIASNCSFVFNEEQLCKVQHYIDAFKDCGHPLSFSISVDGKVIEQQERPLNNGNIRTDEYYERLFLFAKHNNYYFHPMVASNSVKHWIENHKWWESMMKEYDLDIYQLMMLEVRNDDWTNESIEDYNKFMDYLIDKFFKEECHSDIATFSNALMFMRSGQNDKLGGYMPWTFPEADTFIGCTCATDLTVRLGDLALCPCHRTSYNKYLYGYFVLDGDNIVDIRANNPQMASKILVSNFLTCIHGCDTCIFNPYCLKGCFGSQYEQMGDPFIPIPGVCTFFKEKYSHLLTKYKEMGVIDYLRTVTPLEECYTRIKKFLNFYDTWEVEQNG